MAGHDTHRERAPEELAVTDSAPPTLAQGLVAGRYRIKDRIARGGQATVYLAQQVPLGRPVALKLLSPPLHVDAQEMQAFKERFLLEARTLAQLRHPNIVVIHDYGEIGPAQCYIAMEYVEGKRFSEILRERPLDPKRSLRLCYQVCDALRYAHRRGVIHRDIKNSNVLVTRDETGFETVKVVDFGIVKLKGSNSEITQIGVVLGSPHFMAPEQAQGEPVDHRTDIYAVGVLLYCGLMGRYPFNGPDATAIIAAHLTRDMPPFDSVQPGHGVPGGLEAVVRRCLAKTKDERFADMDALMAALRPFVEGSEPVGTAPTAPPADPPPPPDVEISTTRTSTVQIAKGLTWAAAVMGFLGALGAATLVVAMLVWWLGTHGEPTVAPPPVPTAEVELSAPAATPEEPVLSDEDLPTAPPLAVEPRQPETEPRAERDKPPATPTSTSTVASAHEEPPAAAAPPDEEPPVEDGPSFGEPAVRRASSGSGRGGDLVDPFAQPASEPTGGNRDSVESGRPTGSSSGGNDLRDPWED